MKKNNIKVLNNLIENHPRFNGWSLVETKPEAKTRYDFYLQKGEKIILVEYKHRNYNSNAFKDWQVDGNKVTALRGFIQDNIKGVFYLNTFNDDKYALWNLGKDIGEWRLSAAHYAKTVVESELTQTYDLFLSLSDASVTNCY